MTSELIALFVMEKLYNWSFWIFYDAADERTRDWFLMGNPVPVSVLTRLWLWFVLSIGPRFMKNRSPMSLKPVLQIINILQIVANLFVSYEFLAAGWLNGYQFQCEPCDFSRRPDTMRVARAAYIFYLLKILDLLDTVMYVLRRKQNQVTFLHMYHHISTLLLGYIIANYAPGGHATFSQMLNAMVHVIMYGYYFLASLGPAYQPYLWWKKYLTRLQLTQFVVQIAHNVNALRIGCEYPNFIIYLFLPTIVIIFGLFVDFYSQTYQNKNKRK